MKNAYQKNLTSPVVKQDQENKWYSGSQPTFGETLGQIMKVSLEDPVRGQDLQNRMQMRMEDPTSSFYQPYAKATNRSVANLASYGIDTSRMDDKWFADNDYLLGYLRYDGKTNTPSTPKKNASDAEKAAYEYYQIKISEDATRKVENQWNALQEELSYWANRKDRNLSDDQIIDNIDWSKYGALDDLQKKYEQGKPVELNRGTTFSLDAMRGVIWAARNNGGTGNIYQDMARSAVGDGVTWKANDDIADRLNPMSENFKPYSVGSTVDDAALYFGVPSFGKNWLKENNGLQWSDDETERKMYQKVLKAEDNTVKAEQQLDELYSFIDKKINRGWSADKILDRIDWTQYSMLTEMDKSMGTEDEPGSGELIPFTRAIDYKLSDLKKYINEGCEKYAARKKELEYASALQTAANTPASDIDAVTGVMPSYTEQQAAVVAEQNKTLADAADLIDAGGTPSEKTASQNLWDASFDTIRTAVQSIKDSAKPSGTVMYEQTVRKNIGTMSSAMLADADTVQTYNIYQDDVIGLRKKLVQLENKVGDSKEYLAAGKFNPRIVDEEGNLSLSGQAGWNLLSDEEKGYLETVLYYASENPDESMDILADSYNKYLANHISVGDDTINEYRDIVNELDYKEKFLEANQELVAEANANTESAIQQYDALITMMKNAGGDTTELENARQATEFLLNFTKYNPTKWESYNVYDEYSKAAISGMEGFDEMYAFAEQTDKELLENIEVGEWILEYADRVGMEMPDSIRTNVTRWVNALKRQHEDFEYLSVLKNEDREEMVAKGREMGAETAEFDWDVYDGTLESQPAWNLLSEKQKETLLSMQNVYDIYDVVNQMHAYLGGADIENRMFGTYRMRDLLTDYEKETFYYLLAKEGLEGANAYIDHLADASYGVLNSRAADKTRESADTLAGSGIWGRRAADALSMLLSPVAAVGSMYYMAETGLAKLRGEDVEFNPNNVNLSANIYKKEARQKIQEEIAKTYGKDTVLGKFMSGLQEIISNRGDSMMNMLAFGPLFNGIGSKMLNEFVSAAPMAFTAATDAVAEAKENGAADDMQLLGIFAATFLAEAGTEAISIDNMRDAFGMGQDITGRGIKDFLKNWLTKAGISEMVGESFNDIFENIADEAFMGENSEFEKNVRQYMTDEHMSREDAELAARRDQMMGVLHTALISYLSPGMDIGSYLTGNLKGYRGMTKDLQKAGYNVSILDVMRMDKEQRNKAQQKTTEQATETAPVAEQTETQTAEQTEVQNAEPEEGTATVVSEKGETLGTPKTAEEQIATEYQVLDNASDANSTSQTATIAGVLDVDQTDASADVAKATAAKLADTLKGLKFRGQEINPVEFIKNLWIGASETKTDLNTLKTAIQNAVLGGEESAAYEQLTRAKFRKADFDAQVQRLADTVAVDAANSAVQANIANAVRENRVAEAEGIIIGSGEAAKGAVKAAQKAQQTADKAVRTTQRVQDDLTAKQNQREAAAKAVQEASAQFTQNPNADNKNAMIQAIGKLNSASEVVKEYEQSLAKAQADQRTAEANAKTARDDALLQIRQQAEEMVNQEDQRRAGVQQELMAQEQQAMAQMAEQETIRNETENSARMDAEDFIAQSGFENASDEEKQKIRDVFNRIALENPNNDAIQRRDKFVQQVSNKFGINIGIEDTTHGGTVAQQNGYYDRKNNRIVLDSNATVDDAMFFVMGHELTHVAEMSKTYGQIADSLLRMRYGYDEGKINSDIRAKKNLYDTRLAMMHEQDNSIDATPLTEEEARQELVADIMGDLLRGDQDLVNRLVAEEPSTARKILNSIKNFLKKAVGMKGAWVSQAQRTVDMFENALKEAQGQQAAEGNTQYSLPEAKPLVEDSNGNELAVELPGGTVSVDPDIRYSLRSFNGTERDQVRQALYNAKDENGNKRFTKEEVDNYIYNALGVAAKIAQDRIRLDFDVTDENKSMFKPNADYGGSIDASTLCAKRLVYQGTFDAIQHLLPNTPLMPEDLIHISDVMREMGYETPCGICYVESRRRNLDSYIAEWLKDFTGTEHDDFIPQIQDVSTTDGLENVRKNHPETYKAFMDAMNSHGKQNNPKPVQLRTEYKGEIRELSDKQIKKYINHGGIRLQSFSDFETPHLLDMMQVIMDISSKNLTSQAYTKVPNFAWVFGDTGVKINLSLIGKGEGVDANGNLIFDDVEGMPFEEAMKLRNRYSKNVGTILVGINDRHILAAMADPRIDYIIPFHSSGWTKEDMRLMPTIAEYTDYQNYQTEKDLDTGAKTKQNKGNNIAPVGEKDEYGNGYWDFTKSGKENAETYLELCAKNRLIPVFSQFLDRDENGHYHLKADGSTDGYWKMLIDFKMYDNEGNGSPQLPVTPNINMNQAYRVLKDYKLERKQPGENTPPAVMKDNNSLPVAMPVVERIQEEYADKENQYAQERAERMKALGREQSFSLPSDADYLASIERGDMDDAQYYVNAAAENADYTQTGYHGTKLFGFTEFDLNAGQGTIFVSYDKDLASTYTDTDSVRNIVDRAGKPVNHYVLDENDFIDYAKQVIGDINGGKIIDIRPYAGDDAKGDRQKFVIEYEDELEKVFNGNDTATSIWRRFELNHMIDRIINPNGEYSGIYELFLRPGKQLVVDAEGHEWNDIPFDLYGKRLDRFDWDGTESWSYTDTSWDVDFDPEELHEDFADTREIAKWAKAHGYDSVRINNVYDNGGQNPNISAYGENMDKAYGDIGIFFNQDDVKSADTVTYDDNGNIIPLSERFNTNEPDIRYSLPSDNLLEQQIRNYLQRGGRLNPNNSSVGIRQWGNNMAQESDVLAKQAQAYVLNSPYRKDTNAQELARAIQWITNNKSDNDPDGYQESLRKITSPGFNYRTKDGQARMIAMMGMAVAHNNDVNAQIALADAYNKQGTNIAQALQARKLFRLMTPEGRIAVMRKMLTDTQDQINRKGTDVKLAFSQWVYDAAANAADEEAFAKVQQAAAAELAEQLPANWKDRMRAIRMLSMLGNPRTHIRNIIGNALFVPAVGMKNKLGAIGEIVTGQKNRTKTLSLFLNKEAREFARQDAILIKDTLTGEAKYNEGDMVKREQKPFKGLLQAVIDFNGNALEAEDWFFLKGHYRRALGGWMQANGYTAGQLLNDSSLLDQGRAYAINEAQKATYRDFNKMAQTLNKVSREGGAAGFLVDAVLPFKKTPANILRRGIEYSPVGIMRSLTTDIYHLKQWKDFESGKLNALPDKAISPTEFIDHLCSGLAGTAIMAMGALLSSAGIVTCGLDDDDDELEKAKGAQKYSIKILGTDMTFTMDWAAPMSMPFFVGAAIRDELAKDGDVNIDKLIDAFGNITEPVFNLSMLDGINTLFKTSQYDDTNTLTQIGAKIGSNYVTSYVPSLVGAIARTIDDKQRKAFVESGKGTGVTGTFRYAVEQTENKIPFLNQTNIAARDVWGNEKTSGLAERLLENFILPGYVENYQDDPLLNELGRLYDATGDAKMIPSDPGKTISYKGENHALTAEQWDSYKTARGQKAYKDLTELFASEEYRQADPSIQAEMVKEVWDYANSIGKQAVFPDLFVSHKSVEDITHTGTVNGYKNEMMKALKVGDIDTFDDMVEALHEQDVPDSEIKTKIAGTYRDAYKEAYIQDDYETMNMIEDLLDDTGFKFDLDAWEEQADKKYGDSYEKTNTTTVKPSRPASESQWNQYMDDLDEYWQNYDFSKYDPVGRYGKGTIDMNNRIVLHNSDGSISTDRSFSFYDDETGKEVLIPLIVNGKVLTEQQAIDHYYETVRKGKPEYFGMFDDWKDADEYAMMLHNRGAWYYGE